MFLKRLQRVFDGRRNAAGRAKDVPQQSQHAVLHGSQTRVDCLFFIEPQPLRESNRSNPRDLLVGSVQQKLPDPIRNVRVRAGVDQRGHSLIHPLPHGRADFFRFGERVLAGRVGSRRRDLIDAAVNSFEGVSSWAPHLNF